MTNIKDFSVSNVKTFIGNEGHGFNASLLYKGKKIAFVRDMVEGGVYDYEWEDYREKCVEISTRDWHGKTLIHGGTPFEKLLTEATAHLPKETVKGFEGKPFDVYPDNDSVISSLIDKYESDKQLKHLCRTKIVFQLKGYKQGEYTTIKGVYTPTIKAGLERKHGNQLVEIINERFVA